MSTVPAPALIEERRNKDEVLKVAFDGTALDDFGLLTLETVAKLLHCSKAHVSNVIAGRIHSCPPIPAVRLRRRRLVRRETLAEWVEHNEGTNDNLNPSPERGRKNA